LISSNSEYIAVNSISPGLEFETMQKLKAGKVDIGFSGTSMAEMAYRGGVFWKKPVKGLRALFATQPGILNFIAHKNSGINSISDLKGKRIATYSDGNYWGDFVIELLNLHGVNSDNSTILRIMKNDSTRMFINREIDAVIHKFGYGHGKLKEICKTADIEFLEGDPDIMNEFLEKYPSFRLILFGEENGAENTLQLVNSYMTICMEDLPDETAYEITKIWYENRDYLINLLPTIASYINWDNPAEGVTIPFHDGAIKYFKEKGLM
jgi:TRAP transporter TAXI family solute receptor